MDIYGRDKQFERMMERIKHSEEMRASNKKAIIDFLNYLLANGVSKSRALRYGQVLCMAESILRKDFRRATKRDIQRLVGRIERGDYSAWTKHTYRAMIKRFWKWLKGDDRTYPEEVEWIKVQTGREKKLPEELLSEEEIKRMVDAAENPRDKALISVLYESGCRIGEVLALRMRHVEPNEYGSKIIVRGKTGMRKILLISSAPYLATWMNSHPFRDDPDAPLWVTRDGRNLSYSAASAVLKRAAARSGIRKKIYPHLLRHSRATELAKHLTESQMKAYLGWTQSSKMAGVYVHLAGRDVDDALLRMHGIKREEKEEMESGLKPRRCPRCGVVNEATNKFCKSCGVPLDLRTALEVEEKRRAYDEIIGEVLKRHPEIARMIVEKAIEMGLERKLKKMI